MTTSDETKTETTATRMRPHWGMIVLLALLGLLLLGGAFRLGMMATRFERRAPLFGGYSMMFDQGERRTSFGGHLGGGALSNESRIQGVVTAVGGDTLTVAGGGATNQLKTTSSTQYTGGSSAAVNDTVVVFGTTNNGNFTATRIVVNP